MALGILVILVLIILSFIPASRSILGLIWRWLADNEPSIAPLSQLATALGVVVAAITFLRTQRMNRSDWFLKVSKEVVEMMKGKTQYDAALIVQIISFYSVLFSYYHYRLVGKREWAVVEKDLTQFAHTPQLREWLHPGARPPAGFPPIRQFDGFFISYLRDLQLRDLPQ
jgi:hypothetical protein